MILMIVTWVLIYLALRSEEGSKRRSNLGLAAFLLSCVALVEWSIELPIFGAIPAVLNIMAMRALSRPSSEDRIRREFDRVAREEGRSAAIRHRDALRKGKWTPY